MCDLKKEKLIANNMITYKVDILSPKAAKLLHDLADMELIAITEISADPFLTLVNRLRRKATTESLSLEEITKEVEEVRTERYGRRQA
jgi:hypothetical protein